MKARLTVLGSGTSMGVPTIGCDCAVCTSADPHDRRTRPSVMVQWDGHTVLIDTTPDFREQAIREGIRKIDAVLYTHGHADHILGLDDVRPLSFPRVTGGGKIPLYASEDTAAVLRSVFRYIFEADYKYGGLAQVELHARQWSGELVRSEFYSSGRASRRYSHRGVSLRLGRLSHRLQLMCRRKRWSSCKGLDILFLDALRHHPHPTHSTVEQFTEAGGAAASRSAPSSRTSRTICRMRRPMRRCHRMCAWRTTG